MYIVFMLYMYCKIDFIQVVKIQKENLYSVKMSIHMYILQPRVKSVGIVSSNNDLKQI